MTDYTMLLDIDQTSMQKLFGTNDSYIRKVEDEFHVSVVNRDGSLKITGEKASVKKVYRLLQELLEISDKGTEIEEQNVNYAVMMSKADENQRKKGKSGIEKQKPSILTASRRSCE